MGLEEEVRSRAGGRCEYCRTPQDIWKLPFHIEHVIALKHKGPTILGNLALACPHCNLHKGTDLSGIDSGSRNIVPLFNPRHQRWSEHFKVDGDQLIGLTPEGRASVAVLQLNESLLVDIRAELIADGRFGEK